MAAAALLRRWAHAAGNAPPLATRQLSEQCSGWPSWAVPVTVPDLRPAAPLLFCDGASRGNPGPGGAGAFLVAADGGSVLGWAHKRLGDGVTNNEAEYESVILGLCLARDLHLGAVHVLMDSQLVVKQMTGLYAVKKAHLQALKARVDAVTPAFHRTTFTHVPRADNANADALANAALDANTALPARVPP